MTATIRASEPREVLALIPYQLGFQPDESIVLVSLRPPRGRVGLMIRMDLADLAAPDLGVDLARGLISHLLSDGAQSALAVVYSRRAIGPDGGLATQVRETLANVNTAAGDDLNLRGTFLVDELEFSEILGDQVAAGAALSELEGTQIGAHMVYQGTQIAPSRAALAGLPAVSASRAKATAKAAEHWAQQKRALGPQEWRSQSLQLWRQMQRRFEPGKSQNRPTAWGRLAAALCDVTVRDAILVALVPGSSDVPERFIKDVHEADESMSWAIGAIVDRDAGVAPEAELVLPARAILCQVAANTDSGSPAALTLLGILAWWEGAGAEASVWIERALGFDPQYRLARLIQKALDAGMPPGWVRSQRSATQ